MRDNGYWGYTVLGDAQQRPERLDAARDRLADYAALSRSDIQALALRYFDAARRFPLSPTRMPEPPSPHPSSRFPTRSSSAQPID